MLSRAERILSELLVDSGDVALAEALAPELPMGHALGEFRLVREIGRGGMGIVYEAEQPSLSRRVALKILPAGAALDERLSLRFLREARAVAGLRHPGIVPVFTSGRAGGVLYYAMELIDGRSLAEVLAGGPLDPVAAARIAAEIARALDYAHGAGLVHRDVKPENILVCSDGRSRLVDFGLVHDLAAGPLTLSRCVLGTPAFTAPEQARGEPIGPRSDVYSLGAVLYAMLAGTPPYGGDTPSVVLARMLTEPPPPLARAGRAIPPALAAIAERAMAREAGARHASAADLADALERFVRGEAVDEPGPAPRRSRTSARVAALAAVAAAMLSVAWLASAPREDIVVARDAVADGAAFTLVPSRAGRKTSPSLAPGGAQVAYASDADGDWDIYVMDVAGGTAVNLTQDSPLEELDPAFSPDGRSIAFTTARPASTAARVVREIAVLDLAAGTRRTVAEVGASTLAWSADGGAILYTDEPYKRPGNSSSASKLWSVDVAGGQSRPLTAMYALQPAASAVAKRIAFVSQGGGQTDLWTIADRGDAPVRLTSDGAVEWSPVWAPDGRTIFFGSDRDGAPGLWKIALDPATGAAAAAPERVSAAGMAAPFYLTIGTGAGSPLLLVSVGQPARLHRLTPRGAGRTQALTALGSRFLAVEWTDLSPDRRRLAFTAVGSDEDVAVADDDGSEPRLLTRDGFHDRGVRWSPDGGTIAFQSDRSGNREIWTVDAEGRALTRRTRTRGEAGFPVWSPDGQRIAFALPGVGAAIVAVSAAGGPPPEPELLPAVDGGAPFEPSSWSPDGRAIAGTAAGIVVYATAQRSYRRLTDSGARPVWLADGRHLLSVDGRAIQLIDSRTGAVRTLVSAAPAGLSPYLSAAGDGAEIYASLTASADELWRVDLKD